MPPISVGVIPDQEPAFESCESYKSHQNASLEAVSPLCKMIVISKLCIPSSSHLFCAPRTSFHLETDREACSRTGFPQVLETPAGPAPASAASRPIGFDPSGRVNDQSLASDSDPYPKRRPRGSSQINSSKSTQSALCSKSANVTPFSIPNPESNIFIIN